MCNFMGNIPSCRGFLNYEAFIIQSQECGIKNLVGSLPAFLMLKCVRALQRRHYVVLLLFCLEIEHIILNHGL